MTLYEELFNYIHENFDHNALNTEMADIVRIIEKHQNNEKIRING